MRSRSSSKRWQAIASKDGWSHRQRRRILSMVRSERHRRSIAQIVSPLAPDEQSGGVREAVEVHGQV